MRIVDLRSDTITRPTEAMRVAMAEAEVGDDVFGEDPTVNKLEKMAAERLGKEAALFVPSGTMGNMASLLSHCVRGDEIIVGDQSHMYIYEQGGSAALGGIHPRALRNEPDGTIDLDCIEAAIRPDDIHHPRTSLIVLENTHNRCNGSPLSTAYMRRVRDLADGHGLKVHVDGARIFNSAVAQGVPARELAATADSITFCISKGLAAPVGSVVCGTRDFIARARRARKVLGGAMRQAGVIAAAGIVALNEMVERLAEDHANAKLLGEGLLNTGSFEIARELIKTNIVYVGIRSEDLTSQAFVARLKDEGVFVLPVGPRQIRAVTQYHVTTEDIGYTVEAFKKAVS